MNDQPVPAVESLSVLELEAVINNDVDTFALAGAVEVPRALEELKRRANFPPEGADQAEVLEARAAGGALQRLAQASEAHAEAEARAERGEGIPGDAGEGPLELEAGTLERILEGRGYIAVRGDLLRCAQAIMDTDRPTLEAVLRYSENALRQAKAQAAPAEHVEAISREVIVFKAIKRFHRDLHELEEKAKARAVLLGQGGANAVDLGQGRPGR